MLIYFCCSDALRLSKRAKHCVHITCGSAPVACAPQEFAEVRKLREAMCFRVQITGIM